MSDKRKKRTVIVLIVVAIIITFGGYIGYQRSITIKVADTQTAYYALKIPNTDAYTDEEKQEFEGLMVERIEAFEQLNVKKLIELKTAFETLDHSVNARINHEKLIEKYDVIRTELENIELLPEASPEEEALFHMKKEVGMQMIQKMESIEEINNIMEELKKINSDIEQRKIDNKPNDEQIQRSSNPSSYETDKDVEDIEEPSDAPSQPSQPAPTPEPEPAPTTPTTPETCVTKPNGAVVCVGGSW